MTIMLMPASSPIQITRPVAISVPSMSGARRAITSPRQTIPAYRRISPIAPSKPSSYTTTAKMLSVGGTGRPVNLDCARPMPTPKTPPLTTASKDRLT